MDAVKRITLKRTEKKSKRRTRFLPFLLISILLHLLLLLVFYFVQKAETNQPVISQKPDFIEITNVPIPKEKETEPPEKTKRLAERSHKAKEEKTIDDFTRKGQVAAIPRPKTRPVPPAGKKQVKKESRVASIPKDLRKTPQRDIRKDIKKIEPRRLTKEQLFSSSPYSGSVSSLPSRDFLGSRNIPKKEDTVDLNTTEFKYFSYFFKLKQQIQRVWTYPKSSRMRGQQGELLLVFTIRSNGELERITLLDSSLHKPLDDEAIRAISVAAPFIPFPKSWDGMERLNIRAIFQYKLGFWSLSR